MQSTTVLAILVMGLWSSQLETFEYLPPFGLSGPSFGSSFGSSAWNIISFQSVSVLGLVKLLNLAGIVIFIWESGNLPPMEAVLAPILLTLFVGSTGLSLNQKGSYSFSDVLLVTLITSFTLLLTCVRRWRSISMNPSTQQAPPALATSSLPPPPEPAITTASIATPPTFKILLVGDEAVGISAFLNAVIDPDTPSRTTPSGIDVQLVALNTNRGVLRLELWDVSKHCKNDPSVHKNAHGAIIMFDTTVRASYEHVPDWYKLLVDANENLPTVLVGNKVDLKDRKVKPRDITYHRKKNLQYYDISVKKLYNWEKPILWLTKRIAGDPGLTLTTSPMLRQIPDDPRSLKMALVGAPGTGKASFVKKHVEGLYNYVEHPDGLATTSFTVNTTKGLVTLETVHSLVSGPEDSSYVSNVDAVLIFFDVTSRATYKALPELYTSVTKGPLTPAVVLIGSKADLTESRVVKPKLINFHRRKNITYVEVSSQANFQWETAILAVLRGVLGDPGLDLVESPPMTLPEVEADRSAMINAVVEMDSFNNRPIPAMPDDEDV